ncbi:putative leucine-rich repeat-containing protein DDB_G0290503 [Ptychodera flava]|uniref:putative leucine-rich repeat-containing protein DDB_G0290503 n=1 Tax=Ptychodera flava TaxID=63121 RepID=UPI00396AA467
MNTSRLQGYRPPITGALPGIKSITPPGTSSSRDSVSYNGSRSQLSSSNNGQFDQGDLARSRLVEQRLNVAEQSNRTLLDEVVKLQGDLKLSNRRTEDALAAERQARQQLIDKLRSANNLIEQVGSRQRSADSALLSQIKQTERAVQGIQQEILSRGNQQLAKIAELRNDLDDATRMRDKLERAMQSLIDEIKTFKSRVDTQQIEYNGFLRKLKERSQQLEEGTRQAIDETRKTCDDRSAVAKDLIQLKLHINSRLSEIRDALLDIRNNLHREETERRQNETQQNSKMAELQSHVLEQDRKQDETVHAFNMMLKERDHTAEKERLKLQGRVAEIAEEVNKKMVQQEISLREETQKKFEYIEKYLHKEQEARMRHEQAIRDENEKRWNALQKLTQDELMNVREVHMKDKLKMVAELGKTNDHINVLEEQQAKTKNELEQSLNTEVNSRKKHDESLDSKIDESQKRLGDAIAKLYKVNREELAEERTQAQRRAQQTQASIRDLQNLPDTMKQLSIEVANHQEQLAEAQKRIKALQEEQAQAGLDDAQVELADNVAQLSTRVDEQQKDLTEAKKLIEDLKENQTLTQTEDKDQQDESEGPTGKLKEQLDEIREAIKDLENRQNEKVAKVKGRQKQGKEMLVFALVCSLNIRGYTKHILHCPR